jgi:DNA-binding transcriptional regulator YiaG
MTPKDVQALRHRLGLSQSTLAEALGVAKMTVARWEQGVHRITPRTVKSLMLLARLHGRSRGARKAAAHE